MNGLPLIFVTVTLLAAGLASIAIWAPRRLPAKLAALGVSVLFLPSAYAGYTELLSRPKPATQEWWLSGAGDATVLGSMSEEGRHIYLWLRLAGIEEPRSYVLPWSRDMAQQLENARNAAAAAGTGVAMRFPFESSLDDGEPKFYAMPQPAMPPKEAPSPSARQFARPDADA